MQRLEVSGAVRPIKGSLGVKGLIWLNLLAVGCLYLLSKIRNGLKHWEETWSSLITDHTTSGHSETCKCSSGPRNILYTCQLL